MGVFEDHARNNQINFDEQSMNHISLKKKRQAKMVTNSGHSIILQSY